MADKKYDFSMYIEQFANTPISKRREMLRHISKETGAPIGYTKQKVYSLYNKLIGKTKTVNTEYVFMKQETPPLTSEEKILQDKTIQKEKLKAREAEDKYGIMLRENEILEQKIQFLLNIKDSPEQVTIVEKERGSQNNATPIVLLSDWHFEETVEASTINDLNEYNLQIAQKRWFKCIQNSLWLVKNDRNHSNINNIVIWLGGDFITGHIHTELLETSSLSPTHATRFAKKNIIAALDFYLKYGKFKNIYVVCNQGNHGRTTDKIRVSTNYRHSYEWMMYHDIADYFKERNVKNIHFKIPDGFFNYVDVYGFKCRFFHGDVLKYNGGIGGLTIPLIKAIHRMNTQIRADYNFMGHFHQLFQATKDCIVNGSGIGYNAYGQYIGASPEPPLQGYCLIDQKRGMTIKAPIFCD